MSNSSLKYSISGYLALAMNLVVPFIVIPIATYLLGNWWLLLGFFPLFFGETISASHKASKKLRWAIIFGVILFCTNYWLTNGFEIKNIVTFYSLCFLFGFFCHRLYNLIAFSDKTTRSLLAAFGNKQADDLIRSEIEPELKKVVDKRLREIEEEQKRSVDKGHKDKNSD